MVDRTSEVLVGIHTERRKQDARWGLQDHPNGTGCLGDRARANAARDAADLHVQLNQLTFRDILHEEVQEAFAESDEDKLEEELLQVAAVATLWIEAIRRRRTKNG